MRDHFLGRSDGLQDCFLMSQVRPPHQASVGRLNQRSCMQVTMSQDKMDVCCTPNLKVKVAHGMPKKYAGKCIVRN